MYAVSVSNKDISWTHSAWDPTEPVATRPLFTQCGTGYKFFYTCDGNKNVSEDDSGLILRLFATLNIKNVKRSVVSFIRFIMIGML